MNDGLLLEAFAKLLQYPGEDYARSVEMLRAGLASTQPDAASHVGTFVEALRGKSIEQLQELFVQTFDLNPVCALEVGWHLFGDAYERGAFLVRMRQELRRYDLTESTEMPDHLVHVLPALGRMDFEEARKFATAFVLPALDKMLAGLESAGNPYQDVLKAARSFLAARYPNIPEEVSHD